jgi:hypothetical protein
VHVEPIQIEYLLQSLQRKLKVGLKWMILKRIPEDMCVQTTDCNFKSAMEPPYQLFSLASISKYAAELGLCSFRPLAAKARVQPQASPFGICD